MLTLIHQETFKLMHKKSTYFVSLFLAGMIILFGVLGKLYPNNFDPKGMFNVNFTGIEWITFLMIAASASIVAMEFQYGTVKELLYRKYNRGQVLVSKWIVTFIYSLYMYVLALVLTLVLKVVLFNHTIELGKLSGSHTVIENLLISMGSQFIGLWLVLSLVLLLATMFKSSTVAVSAGFIGYFAANIAASLMFGLIGKWEWLKWNPLNMLSLSTQVMTPSYREFTKLTVNQLVMGNLGYIVVFLFLGYLIFKKRNV